MKVRRSLGGGGLARSGAIHAGGMWMLLPDGPPPAQARGMLAVGVTLVEGAGAAGGGEQVSAAVAERIQPAEAQRVRSEEHTSELQSLMRISYAVFCLKNKTSNKNKYSY